MADPRKSSLDEGVAPLRSGMTNEIGSLCRAQVGDIVVQDVPQTPMEALRIFRNPESEDWERDYAAMMITSLDEALPDLVATARDPTVSEMLQQRAAECLAGAWRDRGLLMTADISGFTPIARQEILFHRGEGPPFRG